MLCDKCHKREAKVYYTEIINGQKKEQHLCEECAAEYTQFDSSLSDKELTIGSLLSSILSNYYNGPKVRKEFPEKSLVCKKCNMTYEQFLKTGKFGCTECYKAFSKVLEKNIRQIQGASSHVGKRPKGYVSHTDQIISELTEIDRLSLKLQDAVEKEEFEEAARLRDQIRELKKKEETSNA